MSWLQALHNARNAKVRIAVFGDSYTRCDVAGCNDGPTIASNRWIAQLGIGLQNLYGSGGTGFRSVINQVTETLDPEFFTSTGSVSSGSGQASFGPSQTTGASGSSLVQMSGPSTLTFSSSIPYDHLAVMCLQGQYTAPITITIDGASAGTACGTQTSGAYVYTVSSSSTVNLGTHTAVLSVASGGSAYLYAVSGEAGSTGVVIDDYAVGGANSQWFGGTPSVNMAFADLAPPNLAIFALQTNDNAEGISTATFTQYMTGAIQNIQALATNPSVLLQVPPYAGIGTQSGSQAFAAAQLALAQTLGIDYVSMQDRYGPGQVSANLLNSSHPNDQLSLDEFSVMWAKLIDPVPNAGTFANVTPIANGLANEQSYSASGPIASGVGIALVTATATMTLPSVPVIGNLPGQNIGGDLRVVSLPLSSTPVTTTIQPASNATLIVGGAGVSSFVIPSGMTATIASAGAAAGGGPSWFVTGLYPTTPTSTAAATLNGVSTAQSVTITTENGSSYAACYPSGATCTVVRGDVNTVGGTATTGNIFHIAWPQMTSAPFCTVTQNGTGNGGSAVYSLGHTTPTTTGFDVTASASVSGAYFQFDYVCQP